MSNLAAAHKVKADTATDFDAVIIGAGVSGLYQLYKLRELGMRVRVFETGTGVGGTWYWNRYPGARFDSESYSYGYSFSKELLDEWDWTEHFSPQPETLKYLNYVADKFDLRRDIQFRARVKSAHWQEKTRGWELTLEDGSRMTCRIIDLSASGAAIAAENRPPLKSLVMLGKVQSRVVRNLEEGFALEFIHEQTLDALEDAVSAR